MLLVAGQAVNLWALYYEERTRDLAPFVSRDVDVLGDRATLTRLAKAAGVRAQFFPLRPTTNEVGVVIATGGDGQPLLVEVLRCVHGVSNDELRAKVYTVVLGAGPVRVQVPGPIALLQAKIANVADLPQPGRQDVRHVRILARLMPAYLADLQATVINGAMPERELVDLLEGLLAVITSRTAGRVLGELQVPRLALFAELQAGPLARVRRLVDNRLSRALKQ